MSHWAQPAPFLFLEILALPRCSLALAKVLGKPLSNFYAIPSPLWHSSLPFCTVPTNSTLKFFASSVLENHLSLLGVLVHFHTTDKDITKTGKFTKEKGLIGPIFPHGWGGLTIMAEGKEEQVTSYMDGGRQRRDCAGQLPLVDHQTS